jgi:hypothetical protein
LNYGDMWNVKMVEMILIAYVLVFVHSFMACMVDFMVEAVKLWVHMVIDVDP